MSLKMPSKEEAKEMAINAWEATKTNVQTLNEAGLFKLEHAMAFGKELALPFEPQNFSVAAIQSILLGRLADDDLKRGFTIMNAVAFFLEVFGDLTALLLGRSLPLFVFEIVYAFLVAYVFYWLVVHADGHDYKLVAIGLYIIYALINMVQSVVTLALIVPPFFFFCKTVASLCCAFYAFKIEKLHGGKGFAMLKDDDGTELGVAE